MRLFPLFSFVILPTVTLSTVGLDDLPGGRDGLDEGPASRRSMSGGLIALEPCCWRVSSVVEAAKGENVSIVGGLEPDEDAKGRISPEDGT